MKLKHYLTELAMKSDTKIKYIKRKGHYFNAKITLGTGDEWLFNASDDFNENQWDIAFYAPSISPGLKGDPNKVGLQTFAAIEKLFKEFLKEEDPGEFHFTGGRMHTKLYNKLADRILKTGKYKKGDVPKLLTGNKWSFVKK